MTNDVDMPLNKEKKTILKHKRKYRHKYIF